MRTGIKTLALAAVLATGASSAAMAEFGCPPGYSPYNGACAPMGAPAPAYANPGYSNPVSGAVQGEAAGAASGYASAGPVGAVVGGAIGTATGTLTGTANALSGSSAPPACGYGYRWYNGYCYPNR